MGRPTKPKNVCLISAIFYNDSIQISDVLEEMIRCYGHLDDRSEVFPFRHTRYYADEMGPSLSKFFMSFTTPFDPADLADVKRQTILLEDRFARDGKRNVNIDPGYISAPKLVLATTKNFAHRIYIGKGIYGDVQLFWKNGKFVANPWTYPDYRTEEAFGFFTDVRNKYIRRLKTMQS
jgi:hypothetical protein